MSRLQELGVARPTPALPGCGAMGCLPMKELLRTPARNANAEGSRKEGAREPAAGSTRASASSPRGTRGSSLGTARQAMPEAAAAPCSLVLDLGPLGFQGQVRSLLIKVWSQLQQPCRLNGSHISHIILGGLYNFIVENPSRWLLCIEDRRRMDVQLMAIADSSVSSSRMEPGCICKES